MKTNVLSHLIALALVAGCYPDPDKLQVTRLDDAGTPDPGTPDGGTPLPIPDGLSDSSSAEDRCKAFAATYCARFCECSKSWFGATSLDQDSCQQSEASVCQLLAALPGSTYPNVDCVKGYVGFSCPLLSAGKQPAPCYAPGENSDGQGCSDERQCRGRRCAFQGPNTCVEAREDVLGLGGRRCVFQASDTCGQCASRVAQDGACENDEDCQSDLFCHQKHCTAASETTCAAGPCQPGLRCGTDGTCGPLSGEGGPCVSAADCDVYAGLVCGTKLQKCVKYTASATTCGQLDDGSFVFCADAMACVAGGCLTNAKVGEPCDGESGPYCAWPAACDPSALRCKMPVLDPACGRPVPISGPPTNMAAEISGPTVGYPAQDNETYRRKLTVTILDPQPTDLSVGQAWGLSPGGDNTYLTIPVTNSGNNIICAIVASAITLLDGDGIALGNTSAVLMGSVRTIATKWESSCLGPGETGYLLTIVLGNVFGRAAALRIAFNGTSSGAENQVRVSPVHYSTNLTEQSASLAITVKNTGTVSAALGTKSQFLVLDDVGPVGQGFLSPPTPTKTLEPGDTAELTTQSPGGLTQGHGNRVRVFIDLKQPAE